MSFQLPLLSSVSIESGTSQILRYEVEKVISEQINWWRHDADCSDCQLIAVCLSSAEIGRWQWNLDLETGGWMILP